MFSNKHLHLGKILFPYWGNTCLQITLILLIKYYFQLCLPLHFVLVHYPDFYVHESIHPANIYEAVIHISKRGKPQRVAGLSIST